MSEPDPTRRWEGDEQGSGVAGAAGFVPRLEQLLEQARVSDWVAEDPDGHLWPHLEQAIASAGSPWQRATHSTDPDGRFVVDLEHTSEPGAGGPARLRADALRLVGKIAEGSSFVEVNTPRNEASDQVAPGGNVFIVDVLTGTLDDRTPFRSHGHTLTIRIRAT